LLIAIGPTFRLSESWSMPIDFQLWYITRFRKSQTTPRIAISGQYQIPLSGRVVLYPKIGVGLLLTLPVYTANIGLRLSFDVSRAATLYIEPATLITYRESDRRSNYVLSPIYVTVGLALQFRLCGGFVCFAAESWAGHTAAS
jgi:hypothetical protein